VASAQLGVCLPLVPGYFDRIRQALELNQLATFSLDLKTLWPIMLV
jgi:hypothetical protein